LVLRSGFEFILAYREQRKLSVSLCVRAPLHKYLTCFYGKQSNYLGVGDLCLRK
jgi:hypothetical protein